jgi:sporulation-control protein
MDVVVEADKRGGLFSGGDDALACYTVSHGQATGTDGNAEVDSWVDRLLPSRTGHAAYGSYGHDPYGHGNMGGDAHKDDHGHHGGHRSGPGLGTVVAGAAGLAADVVGGTVAAESSMK